MGNSIYILFIKYRVHTKHFGRKSKYLRKSLMYFLKNSLMMKINEK